MSGLSQQSRVLAAVLVVAGLASFSLGQESPGRTPKPNAQKPAAEKPEAPAPDFVQEPGFKNKLFELKHRDPVALIGLLRSLGSGFKGSAISYSSEFSTLSVRDFPENLAVIEDALKRLDTPSAPSPDIEVHVHVLIASSTPDDPASEVPSELAPVIRQLQSTLRYKHYSLMTSAVHRTREGPPGVRGHGVVGGRLLGASVAEGRPIMFDYQLQNPSLERSEGGGRTVRVLSFDFGMQVPVRTGAEPVNYQNLGFRGPLSVREGEQVVVGTATMFDKGLVVVVSAKVSP